MLRRTFGLVKSPAGAVLFVKQPLSSVYMPGGFWTLPGEEHSVSGEMEAASDDALRSEPWLAALDVDRIKRVGMHPAAMVDHMKRVVLDVCTVDVRSEPAETASVPPEDAASCWLPPGTAESVLERGLAAMDPEAIAVVRGDPDAAFRLAADVDLFNVASDTIAPFTATNLLLFHGTERTVLVDPGGDAAATERIVRQNVRADVPLDVFLTHHHMDHVAALPVVARVRPEARVVADARTLGRIETAGLATLEAPQSIDLGGGRLLRIIATPGHTDGHLSVYDETSGVLAAGDHVVGYGSTTLDPGCGSMREYLQTCHDLIDVGARLLVPAHGPPCCQPKALLEMYIKHRLAREDQCMAAVDAGASSLVAVTDHVYPELSPAIKVVALRNVRMHIIKLVEDGRLPSDPWLAAARNDGDHSCE